MIVKLDERGFKIGNKVHLMFPQMILEKYKSKWVKDHTIIIEVLYSILSNFLKNQLELKNSGK